MNSSLDRDEHWMRQAIELASLNPDKPFAAIVVNDQTQQVLGKGVNESSVHPMRHAEMVALQNCVPSRLKDGAAKTLYTTAEPCLMCQGALVWCGITSVRFGTSITTLVDLGWDQILFSCSELSSHSFREVQVRGSILESECDELFRQSSLSS